jgi:hypothetical protein
VHDLGGVSEEGFSEHRGLGAASGKPVSVGIDVRLTLVKLVCILIIIEFGGAD